MAYRTNPSRIKHRAALIADLETTFIAGTRRHWVDTLLAAGIPAGPINDFAEALENEHAVSRDMVIEIDHPVEGNSVAALLDKRRPAFSGNPLDLLAPHRQP